MTPDPIYGGRSLARISMFCRELQRWTSRRETHRASPEFGCRGRGGLGSLFRLGERCTLTPEPKTAQVRVVAPDISPGTYRSTPWGLLLRVLPNQAEAGIVKPIGTENAPVCTL